MASRGNDGDKTKCNGMVSPNSVAISHFQLNPWYGVDLGVPLKVAGVKLTNTADMPYGEAVTSDTLPSLCRKTR